MTLTEFLLARIAEDEAEANWVEAEGDNGSSPTQHPARILAECAAKRAIIEQAEVASDDREQLIGVVCVGGAESAEGYAADPGKLTLETLAAVYSDHPDYQSDWAL